MRTQLDQLVLHAFHEGRELGQSLPDHGDGFGFGVEPIRQLPGQLVERANNVLLSHVMRAQRVIERAHRLGTKRSGHAQEPLPSTRSAYGAPNRTCIGSATIPWVRAGFITENWYCWSLQS